MLIRMSLLRCPHEPLNLYEINTRVWLRELGVSDLRDVPDAVLDGLSAQGFDLLWLMGVWTPSSHAQAAAQGNPAVAAEVRRALPDLRPADVVASPYAIAEYVVSPHLGGDAALATLRGRLHRRGMGLILDFVPNHTACDHPWLTTHPERFVRDLDRSAPPEWTFAPPGGGAKVFHGRDPYFPPWSDTAQLDLRRRDTRQAVIGQLLAAAGRADGLRCDMAMLLLRDVFQRTWPGACEEAGEFWAEAIDAVRAAHPRCLLLAEAYWGTERTLHALGFDYTYDKELYDALLQADAAAVRRHLMQGQSRQRRALRFLENHDEDRAAARLPAALHRTAALVALTLPGVRLLHHGQLEGARRRLPVQAGRRPQEHDPALAAFYAALLVALQDPVLRLGSWRALSPMPAWPGNGSHDSFVCAGWDGSLLGGRGDGGHRLLVANLSSRRAQCRLPLRLPGLMGRAVVLTELLGSGDSPAGDGISAAGRPVYRRDSRDVADGGLFVDLPGPSAQLLSVQGRTTT